MKFESDIIKKIESSNLEYLDSINGQHRKDIGQIFTPSSIAIFMASLCDLNKKEIKILDPGAGTGILTAALCDKILKSKKLHKIHIDLYENDNNVLPFLEDNFKFIKSVFNKNNKTLTYNIFNYDFIQRHHNILKSPDLLIPQESISYDIVISNPPYYKLSKDHIHSKMMQNIVHGQPNIYFFFMALSAQLLSDKGQLIFITPRSYCSGLYFRIFRKWFLERITLKNIHTFQSRSETFNKQVLQETIIIKGIRNLKKNGVMISNSINSDLSKLNIVKTDYKNIINSNDPDQIIKIPSDNNDLDILRIFNSWESKFSDLGFKISTGPVVSFRATEYLKSDTYYDGKSIVPLLWMNHISNYEIKFPSINLRKPQTIKVTNDSAPLLLKNKNYVLVKRFSSKEQKRRIYAAVYLKSNFPVEFIGIENHLNYIWKPKDELSNNESLGIMVLLNSTLFDKYFRIINGNTQVNASEINNMPFPQYDKIIEIGTKLNNIDELNESKINQIIIETLHIPSQYEKSIL